MHEDYFRAIESGATVITAGRRLARVLTQRFHEQQREQGRSVWNTPDILPLDAFLRRSWWDCVQGRESRFTLIDALQEQVVWEQAIRESPAGDSLLRIPETARQATEAWQLVEAYQLPLDGRFEATDDWSAFAAWARAFRKRCDSNNWLEPARLADVVADLARTGKLARPSKLFLAGFEELTPQQSDLLDALGGWSGFESPGFQPVPERWIFRDGTAEIRAAAVWARRLLEQNSSTQIGVIVSNLTSLRARVERIFRETLDPA